MEECSTRKVAGEGLAWYNRAVFFKQALAEAEARARCGFWAKERGNRWRV